MISFLREIILKRKPTVILSILIASVSLVFGSRSVLASNSDVPFIGGLKTNSLRWSFLQKKLPELMGMSKKKVLLEFGPSGYSEELENQRKIGSLRYVVESNYRRNTGTGVLLTLTIIEEKVTDIDLDPTWTHEHGH